MLLFKKAVEELLVQITFHKHKHKWPMSSRQNQVESQQNNIKETSGDVVLMLFFGLLIAIAD